VLRLAFEKGAQAALSKFAVEFKVCPTCKKDLHYGRCPQPIKSKPAGEPIK